LEPLILLLYLIISVLCISTLSILLFVLKRVNYIVSDYRDQKNIIGDVVSTFKIDIEKVDTKVNIINKAWADKKKTDLSQTLKMEVSDISKTITDISRAQGEYTEKYKQMLKQINELETRQGELGSKVETFKATSKDIMNLREANSVSAIPIRTEKAMSLTDTELQVLNILRDEGKKTPSQIRERINLTREHTSRLMRSLYSRGYIDRSTKRLPYTYWIKKEMEELMTRADT
jgi:DNA repair exonuclease SbcCD ATPase subunit